MILPSLQRYGDWGLLALRLAIGVIFLYHGTQKWGLWSAVPEGMPANALLLMKILSIAEPLGGAALILGFLTQFAALGLAIIMLGAIYTKSQVTGVGFAAADSTGWEFDLVLLAGNLVLFFLSAGRLSIEGMMRAGPCSC